MNAKMNPILAVSKEREASMGPDHLKVHSVILFSLKGFSSTTKNEQGAQVLLS